MSRPTLLRSASRHIPPAVHIKSPAISGDVGCLSSWVVFMQRFALMRGAQPDTLVGLSGLGDLVLTCSSELSRNYRFGLSLGQKKTFDSETTVEGVATARAMTDIAAAEGLDMPISTTVADLSHGAYSVTQAIQTLLNRPLKEE